MAAQTANYTYFASGVGVQKTDGTYVDVIDRNGNVSGVDFTFANLTTTGNTILGNAVTDTTAINGATTITTTSASGLTVGRQGATAPVLQVDAATASVATGVKLTGAAAAGGVAIAAISSGTDENLTIDAKGTGTVTIASVSTGRVNVNSSLVITTTQANGLIVGANGVTNPVFQVNANTASVATGLRIVGAAAAGGLAVSVLSSATDESMTINAKGTGTITLGSVSTGNIVFSRATTGVSSSITGAFTGKSATAIPATAGAVAAGAPLVMNSNGVTIEWTTDAPTHVRVKGSLCFNINGSSGSTRGYINTDGSTGWTAITTAT